MGTSALEERWHALSKSIGIAPEAASRWWPIICNGYSEEWRHYHTLAHLGELFDYVDEFRRNINDRIAVELAVFFHDVVYLPKAKPGKNEDDSAEAFSQFAQEVNLEPALRVACVYRWIVQTKHHVCKADDESD